MKIRIQEMFANDRITREAGETLRKIVVASLNQGQKTELDFSGCVIASTSFLDESIAKLALEQIPHEHIKKHLSFSHLHPRDRELLLDLCKRRGVKISA